MLQGPETESTTPDTIATTRVALAEVATDLFEWKKDTFLLIIDHYSRYIGTARLDRPTADEVITRTKSIFARHGIPEIVISDSGPQYTAEAYTKLARSRHITSSPYFLQSNGEAERVVKIIKELLKKSKDPYLAVLAYCTTLLAVGYSPSQLLVSRTLRSTVSTMRTQRAQRVPDDDAVLAKDRKIRRTSIPTMEAESFHP